MDSVWIGLQLLMDLFIDSSELIPTSDQSIYENPLARGDTVQRIVSLALDQDRLAEGPVSLLGGTHGHRADQLVMLTQPARVLDSRQRP